MSKRKKARKHWYRLHYSECGLCGKQDNYRERVYGKKPKKGTRTFRQFACDRHFL